MTWNTWSIWGTNGVNKKGHCIDTRGLPPTFLSVSKAYLGWNRSYFWLPGAKFGNTCAICNMQRKIVDILFLFYLIWFVLRMKTSYICACVCDKNRGVNVKFNLKSIKNLLHFLNFNTWGILHMEMSIQVKIEDEEFFVFLLSLLIILYCWKSLS